MSTPPGRRTIAPGIIDLVEADIAKLSAAADKDEADLPPLCEECVPDDLHNLTHLPKRKGCAVCERAKCFFTPARSFQNQSEARREAQEADAATEPLDLIVLDIKVVTKCGKSRVQEVSFNILDTFSGATLTYEIGRAHV